MKVLGWIAKSNLGSAKEFDPAMKPEDAIDVDKLTGIGFADGVHLQHGAANI